MSLRGPSRRQLTPAISQFLTRELAHLLPCIDLDADVAHLEVTVSAQDSNAAARYACDRARAAMRALDLVEWECEVVSVMSDLSD